MSFGLRRWVFVLTLAAGATAFPSTAYAADCPSGYTLVIYDGARLHRAPALNSPVDGVYYRTHDYHINGFQPGWVNLTDDTTGVTGFVNDSVAHCAGITVPQHARHE